MSTVLRGNDNFDSASPVSTTYGAVGTYAAAVVPNGNTYAGGDTISGSSLKNFTGESWNQLERFGNATQVSAGLSGTWRCMAPFQTSSVSGYAGGTIWVRIS